MAPIPSAPSSPGRALSRWGWALAAGIVAVSCAATWLFALSTLTSRPLDGSEGNFLFDASRIRAHLPLYVDPATGSWDYGPVPSRYYVLYAPLWAALLALAPGAAASVVARVVSMGAWLGLLVGLVVAADRERRVATAAGAAFVASLYPVTLFAASGRSDAIAVTMAGVALFRSVRRDRVGGVDGALFALAPFFKPNVVAAGAAALLVDVAMRKGRAWPAVAGAVASVLVCAGALQAASGGAWMQHLLASSLMPFSASLWREQIVTRAPFFALPLGLCAWVGARAGPRAWVPLAASTTWALWSLAKIGSASNYWMEPCVSGLVILATAPLPVAPGWLEAAAGPVAAAQVAWTGLAAVRSSFEATDLATRKAVAIAGARARCGAGASDAVVADEPGLEVMLDGRLLEQPLVLTQRVRAGRYPLSSWTEDVSRPAVRCLALQSDWLERTDERPDHDLFPPELRPVLRDRFTLIEKQDGVWLYRAR